MSPYGEIWTFTRERLAQSYQDLRSDQLIWKPNESMHSIGEMLYHVAGVEVWFSRRLAGVAMTPELNHLEKAARDSFITDQVPPFGEADMTVEKIDEALSMSRELVAPVLQSPTDEQLTMDVETVIGPIVEGRACLWRLAQHSAYHTGQIWTYRQDPRFPA